MSSSSKEKARRAEEARRAEAARRAEEAAALESRRNRRRMPDNMNPVEAASRGLNSNARPFHDLNITWIELEALVKRGITDPDLTPTEYEALRR